MLTITFLGLASGIPLGVVMTLVQTWLTDAGIDIKTIGLVSLVQLPYTLKFLWSPLMDRFSFFGSRRKGWMFISQLGMFLCILGLSFFDPKALLAPILILALLISFFGASHDIVIDAFRRDILDDDELGFGSAVSTNSYLIGFRFLTTVLGLALADWTTWSNVFLVFAFLCVLGVVGTLIAPQPQKETSAPKDIREAVINPFLNYLARPGAFEILLFILLYKVGDNFAANLLQTFYLKIEFTKTEIAAVSKLIGFWCTFVGTFIGGFFLFKFSIRKCLLWFGGFQAFSTLGFALLNEVIAAGYAHRLFALGTVVGFENITSGMGTAAFSAFMLKLTDRRFSATQFALLTSFMGIPRVLIPGWAGYIAEPFGWTNFFIFSAFIAVPGMLLVFFRGKKWEDSMPA